jgi:hypothetical protein
MANEVIARKVYGTKEKAVFIATHVYVKGMKFDHENMAKGSFIAQNSTTNRQISFNLYSTTEHPTPFVGERWDADKQTTDIPKDSAARLSERGYKEITDRKQWPVQVIQAEVHAPTKPTAPAAK